MVLENNTQNKSSAENDYSEFVGNHKKTCRGSLFFVTLSSVCSVRVRRYGLKWIKATELKFIALNGHVWLVLNATWRSFLRVALFLFWFGCNLRWMWISLETKHRALGSLHHLSNHPIYSFIRVIIKFRFVCSSIRISFILCLVVNELSLSAVFRSYVNWALLGMIWLKQ